MLPAPVLEARWDAEALAGGSPFLPSLKSERVADPAVYAQRSWQQRSKPRKFHMHLKRISTDVRPALAQNDDSVAKRIAEVKVNTSAPPYSGPLPKG